MVQNGRLVHLLTGRNVAAVKSSPRGRGAADPRDPGLTFIRQRRQTKPGADPCRRMEPAQPITALLPPHLLAGLEHGGMWR